MKNNYLLYNGEILPRNTFPLSNLQVLLLSGQILRLDLFASGNRIPFLSHHLAMLGKQFEVAGWILPAAFEFDTLRTRFEKLLNKNRLFKGSRIHWFIFPMPVRESFHDYTGMNYAAYTEELDHDYFPLNQKGLAIGISVSCRNAGDPVYQSFMQNGIRDLILRQEALDHGWDEIILTDQDGHLSEASEGNLFIRMKNEIFTPSPANHPLPRVMYQVTRYLCTLKGLTVRESPALTPELLLDSDEIFIADDIHGIRWVLSYENKRYYRKTAGLLSEELRRRIAAADQFHMGSSG